MRSPRREGCRPFGVGAVCAVVALAWILGCSQGHYGHYRSANPGWRPKLPEAPDGLPELLAALEAPDRVPGIRVETDPIEVLRVQDGRWRPVPAPVGALPRQGDLAVVARRVCRFDAGVRTETVVRVATYLLPRGVLQAHDHREFGPLCEVSEFFRAARAEAVTLETRLGAYVRRRFGAQPLTLQGLYRRGLGYVEAGRIDEAESVLAMGEGSYHQAIRVPGAEGEEVRRLRSRLRKALGR